MHNEFGDRAHIRDLERRATRKPQMRDYREDEKDSVTLYSGGSVAGAAGAAIFALLNLFS